MAWTLKNAQTSGSVVANPAVTPAFTNPLTNFSLIIVGVGRASTTVSTPTDTAGNTYLDSGVGAISVLAGTVVVQLFYALNTHTTASNVVSVANAGGAGIAVYAAEYTGGVNVSPVDKTSTTANGSTGVGGGQNMTSGSATTTQGGELIIGLGGDGSGGTITVGTGFAQIISGVGVFESQIQAAAGSIAATWNDSVNSASYGAIMATFKNAVQDEDFYKPPLPQFFDPAITVY